MARKRDVDVWIWDLGSQLRRHNVEVVRTHVSVTSRCVWSPKIDVVETSSHLILVVEIAGVSLEKVELTYSRVDHSIRIRGRRDSLVVESEGQARIHQLEIMGGEFERELSLPAISLDLTGIVTNLNDGLMAISIPKA